MSKKDIDKISHEILRGSKSLDVFPTPIDKIISYSELVVREDIDLTKIHTGYISQASDILMRAVSKVRGLLDRKEKTIFLDQTQGKERKNFVKLHEVGHEVLPWQKNLHEILHDDDESLSNDVTEEFEAEANYFASITLFQNDRFMTELNKLSLSIESPMQLAKIFGASVHAALRRYVECSKNSCALLVLENISSPREVVKCNLKDKFQSEKFTKMFGELLIPFELGYTWPFVQDYYFRKKFKKNNSINLPTDTGKADFTYQFFNNGYNAFVFIFPIGEKKSSRTTIILTGKEFEEVN
ncbi:MAG: ImmA/IrrE family metallo-endopeptidase [Bacteroidota bacterium]